jgi:hypothetical protein
MDSDPHSHGQHPDERSTDTTLGGPFTQNEATANGAAALPAKSSYRFAGELPAAFERLRDAPRWVCWDYRLPPKKKKWTKPPFNPRTGRNASISNPKTWGTFAEALDGMKKFGFAGVGLVLFKGGGIMARVFACSSATPSPKR